MYARRLKLKNTSNTRELGGYLSLNGIITRYGKFLRSDDVSYCDPFDVELLKNYGVKTIIDFRSIDECAKHKSIFLSCDGIKYFHIPLMTESTAKKMADIKFYTDMVEFYSSIIDNHEAIKELFDTIADNQDGCILYHCIAGKDRTGIISMLLLALVGVDMADIIADYMVTSIYNRKANSAYLELFPEFPVHLLDSKPEWIETAYNYVNKKYGNVESYLKDVNVSDSNIRKIKQCFAPET